MRTHGIVLVAVIVGATLSCGKDATHGGANEVRTSSAPKAAFPPTTSPVQVLVRRHAQAPGRLEYRYTVINGSAFPVHTLLVGYDEYYGVPKLASYPVGWDGDSLPSSSYGAPPGWEFQVQPTEEESLIAVEWRLSRQGRAIMSGETLGGFAVVVEHADSTYDRGGMWTAYLMGESPVFGALRADGAASTPPVAGADSSPRAPR